MPVNCCPGTNYVSSDFTGQVDSNGNGLYTVWFNNNIGNAFTMLSAWLPNYNYGNALTTLETYAGTVPAGPCPVVADATVSGPTQLDLFGGAHWTGAWTAGGTAPTPDPPYYLTQAAYYTSFTAVGS